MMRGAARHGHHLLWQSPAAGAFVGTLLALYSAFCFSCYAVLLRWGQKTDMSVALIWNAIYLIAGDRPRHPAADGAARARTASRTSPSAGGTSALTFVMGAVQLTLGLILFTIGSRSVPAAQLSLIALVEPTLSPLWAWLASGELPPIWTFIGGAVIVAAIVIQALFAPPGIRRHARQSQPPAPRRASFRPFVTSCAGRCRSSAPPRSCTATAPPPPSTRPPS